VETLRAIVPILLLSVVSACAGGSSTPGATQSVASSSPTSPTLTGLVQHDEPGPAPPGAIEEVMNHIAYEMPAITAPHGQVVIHLVNEEVPPTDCNVAGPGLTCLDHDIVITDSTGNILAHSARVKPGHDSVFVLDDVPAGSYRFYCSNGGHASNGMKGTLTVS
jgi:plastocyanin